ncbi:MAG: tRNA (adenosine(37)-N6)-threonylcarbamoyltransferase complex dimerization subunit type 1 TsaB [Clostridiales Family XIII bacterium]|jgi:ribosomal-protein-alanine N-acetyltransferase|nr:tRNA (adenosine(37)-N6)-threonylcarbamoyltransferase complex dimerization subunit type 1 TsaB [Clostridiales Family XIII bacterium]
MNPVFKTLLAIETTGPLCSVALLANGHVHHRASSEGLRHLTSLVPMIDEVVSAAGLVPTDLEAIAVSAGPGSFTGIRIGVATARALAQTIGIPVIKVPTLETFVYLTEAPCIVCPVFDARRDQIYAGAYYLEPDGRIMTLVNGGAYIAEDFLTSLGRAEEAFRRLMARTGGPGSADGAGAEIAFEWMGDGAHLIPGQARDDRGVGARDDKGVGARDDRGVGARDDSEVVQDARAVLRWALAQGRPTPGAMVEPIYMRKAEATRKLEEKLALERSEEAQVMPEFGIRPATPDDVYGMSVVERLSFGEPWLEQSILDDLTLPYSDYVVCVSKENPGFVAAYAGLHRVVGEGNITNIAVHPSVRRSGIGTQTLIELMHRAGAAGIDSFTLEVRASDTGAVDFYKKLGFEAEGRRKNYYAKTDGGGREDALIMWRRGG